MHEEAARALYQEYESGLIGYGPARKRGFRTRVRNLARKLDVDRDVQALLYLDVLATRMGFDLGI
jgi:hypothetical protein